MPEEKLLRMSYTVQDEKQYEDDAYTVCLEYWSGNRHRAN